MSALLCFYHNSEDLAPPPANGFLYGFLPTVKNVNFFAEIVIKFIDFSSIFSMFLFILHQYCDTRHVTRTLRLLYDTALCFC